MSIIAVNRTILITGASSGLGLSLALKFLASGDRVVGISRTKKSWRGALRKSKSHPQFFLYRYDVSREQEVKKIVSWYNKKFKKIDILINNAGYGGTLKDTHRITSRDFRRHLEQNLCSVFLMCKYFIPLFRRYKGGLIINISSMAGKRAVPRLAAYSATKFGVLALSQAIAKENQEFGIKCITVCPGGMNTTMRASLFGRADANRQQSTDYVADVVLDIARNKVKVDSGGDIVIRHGAITAIHPCPEA